VIAWNRAIEEMTGIKKADILGRHYSNSAVAFYGEQRPFLVDLVFQKNDALFSKYNYIEQRKNTFYAEVCASRLYGDKGAHIWIKVSPLLDPNGNIIGGIESIRDITEHVDTENKLKNMGYQKDLILRSSGEGILGLDLNGNHTFINPSAAKMLGYGEEELIGRQSHSTWHHTKTDGTHYPEEECPTCKTLKDDKFHSNSNEVFWRKDGSSFPVSYMSSPIQDEGKTIGAVVTFRDITKSKRVEEALMESETRYRRLIEAATDYIYSVTIKDGSVVATTHGPGCEGVTGYGSDEYEADPYLWYRMIHEEDRDAVIRQSERVLAGELPSPLEHRIIHKDGSVRWVKNTPVPHYEGKILVAYDGLIVDITERKHVEEEFYQSQKLESIGRLAGGVAHDFNNCLTAIMGFSELSMADVGPKNKIYKNLETIHASGLKAAGICRQLLAFSRKQIIEPKVLNINDIIPDLNKMLKRLMGEDIRMETALAPDLGNVKADLSQIEQILMNLAVNARDAMPDGGELLIKTANIELDEFYAVNHVGLTPGKYVMVVVEDTGTGMTEKIKAHIFEPFFTTKGKDKGTGLGLATVYGIVKQNGGNIWCYSEEGKGTTFKIYLPRVYEKADVLQQETMEAFPTGGTETILVIEDEDGVRKATVNILKQHGYAVIEAGNGGEALDICEIKDRPIDLVLTDVVMPYIGGREFIKRLKILRNGFKVLYMSGYTNDVISHHGILEQGVNFIGKPFSSSDLLRKVRDVLTG